MCHVSVRASRRWLDATSSSEDVNAARSSGVFVFRNALKKFLKFFDAIQRMKDWLAIGRIAYDSLLSKGDETRALDVERRHPSKAHRERQEIESREKSIDSRYEKSESRAEMLV